MPAAVGPAAVLVSIFVGIAPAISTLVAIDFAAILRIVIVVVRGVIIVTVVTVVVAIFVAVTLRIDISAVLGVGYARVRGGVVAGTGVALRVACGAAPEFTREPPSVLPQAASNVPNKNAKIPNCVFMG